MCPIGHFDGVAHRDLKLLQGTYLPFDSGGPCGQKLDEHHSLLL